jgi:cAMP-dependent protein kinase regulator
MQRSKTELAQQVRLHKDRASDLMSNGRVESAIGEYLEVLRLAPDDVFARQRAAELLARLGHRDRAIEHYRVLVGKFAADGRLMKAIANCQLILQLEPADKETLSTLSALYAERDTARSSVKMPAAMSAAIKSSPSQPPPTIQPATLGRIPLFSELARGSFESVVRKFARVTVAAGATIIEEGEPGDALFAIATGVVRVERRVPGAPPRAVAEMTEGDFFGEMSLLAQCPRFASVVAVTECELLRLARQDLEDIVRGHPRIGDAVHRFHRERLVANLWRASKLFSHLPRDSQRALADLFRVQHHAPGTVLLEQGAPGGAGLFFLLRGQCEVFHRRADRTEEPYPPLREGDLFGEVSLLQGGTVTASVRTAAPSVVLTVPREWVDVLMLQHPETRATIYEIASKRLGRTEQLLSKEKLDERLV